MQGVKGLYDYGPPGAAVKGNLQQLWKKHFITYDNMLEVDCTALTPYDVLEASGHTAKFCDLLVSDSSNNAPYRADHLLQDKLEELLKNPKLTEDERTTLQTDYNRADEVWNVNLEGKLAKNLRFNFLREKSSDCPDHRCRDGRSPQEVRRQGS